MSTFDEILSQVVDLLQREGRVSYRALKRRFALDDEYIDDLKAEIIQAKKLAIDEDGAVLVWTGKSGLASSVETPESKIQESQKSKGKSQKSKIPNPRAQILEPQSEAEACFHKAIDIARTQQAKSLELRAVMSLVRLRQQPAMQSASRNTQHAARAMLDEAHKLLSEIYNWFTEGFDTKDLQEAKALLDELR